MVQFCTRLFLGVIDLKVTTLEQLQDTIEYVAEQINQRASTDTATTSTAGLMSAADKTKLDGLNNADLSAYVTANEIAENYVAKVSGKGLSTNDYTTAEKNKLAGIDLSNYVAKDGSKVLSTNDFTTAFKNFPMLRCFPRIKMAVKELSR